MLTRLRHSLHLTRIMWVLARNDIFSLLKHSNTAPTLQMLGRLVARRDPDRSPGEKLASALESLGPTFIKLGQALASRADIIGEEMATKLTRLQDRLPPFSYDEARAIIEEELEAPLEQMFEHFEEQAVAAASIAQVHRARTIEGRPVAVKVIRPGVRRAFARDIASMHWMARLIERYMPAARRLKPMEVIDIFEQTVSMEMDLRFEAAAASELAENMADFDYYRVPDIDWTRTGARVLTMEWIDGIPLYDKAALLAAGHDLPTIVERSGMAFFAQAYRDGFFHADMHMGNLFVDSEGRLVAVDFGIMGRLTRRERLYLVEMLYGFLTRDYLRVAQVHFDAGYIPPDQDVAEFARACRSISEPIMGKPLSEISAARMLAQLFSVTETFKMETQPQLLLLQKSLVLVEGIGRHLYPDTNMWEQAEPLIRETISAQLGPKAQLQDRLRDATRLMQTLPSLVSRAERILQRIEREGVSLHPDTAKHFARRGRTPRLLLWLTATALALLVALEIKALL